MIVAQSFLISDSRDTIKHNIFFTGIQKSTDYVQVYDGLL